MKLREKMSAKDYLEYRKYHPIDFVVEGDVEGFSCVTQEGKDYYLENWRRPTQLSFGKYGDIKTVNRPYWERIDRQKISAVQRGRQKKISRDIARAVFKAIEEEATNKEASARRLPRSVAYV
jgi:hypothetical protein